MPIEHSAGGTVITGDSINFLALVAQRGAAELEQKGIKMHRRGPALWKVYREHYKIPGTGKRQATQQQVIDWLNKKVEELKAQQEHVVTENGRTIREVEGRELN